LRIGLEDCPKYFNGCKLNIGVLLGEPLADIDLDCPEAISVWPAFAPDTGVIFGRASAPASHWFYNADPPQSSMAFPDPLSEVKGEKLLELRCQTLEGTVGNQSIVPTSFHKDTGEEIRFEPGKDQYPANVEWGDLKRAASTAAAAALFARHWPAKGRHDTMLALAGVLCRAGWPEGDAKVFCRALYRAVATHDPAARARSDGEVHSTYEKIANRAVTGIPTLTEHIDKKVVDAALQWLGMPLIHNHTIRSEYAPILTEIGNAERFASRYGGDVRFCHQLNTWFVWDGKRLAPDEIAQVERYAKGTVRQLYRDALLLKDKDARESMLKFAMRSDSDHGVRALLARAAAEEGTPVRINELDANPWLLNVENGTIDLRTGGLREHNRADGITKLAPVRFDSAAACPRWRRFLSEIFEPHRDVVEFIQRAVGYSLTGDTREECLFLAYGTRRNGKGTLTRTLQAMLGDYGGTADFSTFVAGRDDRGPRDDVANMRGRRFVVSQEVREGAALAESLVKWLTGGDLVRARNLYERSTEWLPTHHLWLAVNHKPVIRGTDPGIWSRIRLLPFSVSFDGREDKALKMRLLEELPGILAWAVEGCLNWQKNGLRLPESVKIATAEYRAESDIFARFVEDVCIVGEYVSAKAKTLHSAYKVWAEQAGETVLSETAFGRRLTERGFQKEHTRDGKLYRRIGLRA
jgi:putative DNA primase/helicase